jgi:hypothetical protein
MSSGRIAMSDAPRLAYCRRPDATSEAEVSALAAVYRLCLESHAKKNAVGVSSTNGDDAKERSKDDSSARTIIPDRT